MGEYAISPWSVKCLEDFLYYCCPECDIRDHSKDNFLQHAFSYHPDANEYLSILIGIKTENSNYISESFDLSYEKDITNDSFNLKCETIENITESQNIICKVEYEEEKVGLFECPKTNCNFEPKTAEGLTKHLNSHKDCPLCNLHLCKNCSYDDSFENFGIILILHVVCYYIQIEYYVETNANLYLPFFRFFILSCMFMVICNKAKIIFMSCFLLLFS